ncbi:MAG: hypothetical protein QXM92_03500 [Candidatus Anstonellales archaeon]
MTAFNRNDLPGSIDTVEKLALWCALVLQKVNPTKAVLETANANPERVAQVALIRADDDTIRAVCRLSIEIDPSYGDRKVKFWQNARELSNVDIPASFKTDNGE